MVLDGLDPVDLVHANSIETAVLGRIVADHHDVPLVVTIHEHAPHAEPFGRGRMRLAFRRLAPEAVVAPSSFYYDRARAEGVPEGKIHLIPHGVEIPATVLDRPASGYGPAWGLPADAWVALCVGRIYRAKGTLELIRAMAMVRTRMPRVRAVVVGPDGPSEYADAVREEVRRLGMDEAVRFAGPRPPEEMPDVLRLADAVVAPSLAEGFGLAVAEAMGHGKPVVAAAAGGLTDLVTDGVDGLLVPPGEAAPLAGALGRLAGDSALGDRLGAAARRTVLQRHDVRSMVACTTALYDRLVPAAPRTVVTAAHVDAVDALLLDVGGVLLKPDPDGLRRALGPDGPHPSDEAFDRALYRHGEVGAGLAPGDDDDDFVFRYLLSAGLPEERIRARFPALRAVILERPWVAREPEATRSALADLAARAKYIVIISNAEGGTAALLARLRICQVGPGDGVPVRLVVDSSEVGVHKPDPEIYRYAARQIEVAEERCLHVGDSVRNDVLSATAAGAAALHFCPYGDCQDPGHGHVRSLRHLVSLLDGRPR